MKRRSFWLGAVLAAILLCLAVVLVLSPWDTPSLAEQIAADQDLPAGSVTLLSEGTLTQGQEQAVGFFDHQGRPGLALVSKEEPGRLLRVESASSFSSRVPAVWITYLSLGGENYGVLLSRNPNFTCLKVRQAEGTWQEIPVPPPPAMVCFALGERSAVEYQLCDAAGAEL